MQAIIVVKETKGKATFAQVEAPSIKAALAELPRLVREAGGTVDGLQTWRIERVPLSGMWAIFYCSLATERERIMIAENEVPLRDVPPEVLFLLMRYAGISDGQDAFGALTLLDISRADARFSHEFPFFGIAELDKTSEDRALVSRTVVDFARYCYVDGFGDGVKGDFLKEYSRSAVSFRKVPRA